MTKEEAHKEVLRRWRALPIMERQTLAHAMAFGPAVATQLNFRTMGNIERVATAWLIRDLQATAVAVERVEGVARARAGAAIAAH